MVKYYIFIFFKMFNISLRWGVWVGRGGGGKKIFNKRKVIFFTFFGDGGGELKDTPSVPI